VGIDQATRHFLVETQTQPMLTLLVKS
jgi:hypothetical protein